MTLPTPRPPRNWPQKFGDAFRGLRLGIWGQSSFIVHLTVAAMVVVAGVALQVELWQWCVLVLCMAIVLTAELVNTAIETLARGLEPNHNPVVGRALDIAAGAVLLASIGAAVVGSIVLGHRLLVWLNWLH